MNKLTPFLGKEEGEREGRKRGGEGQRERERGGTPGKQEVSERKNE